jgi:hypothetical protein
VNIRSLLHQHKITIIVLVTLLLGIWYLNHISPTKQSPVIATPHIPHIEIPNTETKEGAQNIPQEIAFNEGIIETKQPLLTKQVAETTISEEESMVQGALLCKLDEGPFKIKHACSATENCDAQVWLTVFVHGILSIRPHLTFSMVFDLIRDKTEDTVYAFTIDRIRKDPFFYKNQAMQEVGLQPIDMSMRSPSAGLSTIINSLYKSTLEKPVKNYFYTFGWSGLLSPHERYREAKNFYLSLANELEKFARMNIKPKVRLFGYSHGGNLCLNLAAVKQREFIKKTVSIDEMVLFGVPIQEDSDHLVADDIFKRVYHFYSHGDRVQQLDFFSFNRFFSHRTFKQRRNFQIPQKLTQIQLQSFRKAEHKKERAAEKDPAFDVTRTSVVAGTSLFLRNADPGHAEFWFFGWTPNNYRRKFPLYPLPIVAIAPVIIQAINNLNPDFSAPYNSLIVDLRPDQNVMLLKNKQCKECRIVPFLTAAELAALKEQAFRLAPVDRYTQQEYDTRVRKTRREITKERIIFKKVASALSKKNRKPQSLIAVV